MRVPRPPLRRRCALAPIPPPLLPFAPRAVSHSPQAAPHAGARQLPARGPTLARPLTQPRSARSPADYAAGGYGSQQGMGGFMANSSPSAAGGGAKVRPAAAPPAHPPAAARASPLHPSPPTPLPPRPTRAPPGQGPRGQQAHRDSDGEAAQPRHQRGQRGLQDRRHGAVARARDGPADGHLGRRLLLQHPAARRHGLHPVHRVHGRHGAVGRGAGDVGVRGPAAAPPLRAAALLSSPPPSQTHSLPPSFPPPLPSPLPAGWASTWRWWRA